MRFAEDHHSMMTEIAANSGPLAAADAQHNLPMCRQATTYSPTSFPCMPNCSAFAYLWRYLRRSRGLSEVAGQAFGHAHS